MVIALNSRITKRTLIKTFSFAKSIIGLPFSLGSANVVCRVLDDLMLEVRMYTSCTKSKLHFKTS